MHVYVNRIKQNPSNAITTYREAGNINQKQQAATRYR